MIRLVILLLVVSCVDRRSPTLTPKRNNASQQPSSQASYEAPKGVPVDDLVAQQAISDEPKSSLLALRLAAIASHTNSGKKDYWLAKVLDPSVRQANQITISKLRQSYEPNGAIAIAAPLSGVHQRSGEAFALAVRATLLAHLPKAQIELLDTQGAEQVAYDKVRKSNASLILGPLGMRESLAAARAASEAGIPIGIFSPHTAGNAKGNVFQLVPSPRWESSAAAKAAKSLGYRSVAVLAPRNELGRDQVSAFIESAKMLGLTVKKAGFYDPSGMDLQSDIRRWLNLTPSTNPRLSRHLRRYGRKKGMKTYSPKIEFDLLYVPDELNNAILTVAHLRYFNIEFDDGIAPDTSTLQKKHGGRVPTRVQLMGNSGWHKPNATAGNHGLDGSLVVTRCPGPKTDARFIAAYAKLSNSQPSSFAWEIRDGVLLMINGLKKTKGVANKLRHVMFRLPPLKSGCGTTEISSKGEASRKAGLLSLIGEFFEESL